MTHMGQLCLCVSECVSVVWLGVWHERGPVGMMWRETQAGDPVAAVSAGPSQGQACRVTEPPALPRPCLLEASLLLKLLLHPDTPCVSAFQMLPPHLSALAEPGKGWGAGVSGPSSSSAQCRHLAGATAGVSSSPLPQEKLFGYV